MGQLSSRELRDEDSSSLFQAFDHSGISVDDAVPERRSTPCGRITTLRNEVLCSPRNSVQGSAVTTCRNFLIGLCCLFERQLFGNGDRAFEHWVEFLQPVEIELGQLQRRKLMRLNQSR